MSHTDLQAVNADGTLSSPFVGASITNIKNKVVIEGIALNNPEDMLDPTTQWQVFVQGEGTDTAGTAAWAGRFFQQSVWADELARLNGSGFRAGDQIRITGWAAAAGGKANINERHSPDPIMNFEVEKLETGGGLPDPEWTTIADMNRFDPTRTTGGERYIARRIRLNDVYFNSDNWGKNQVVIISDSVGNTLPLRLCNLKAFDTMVPPTGPFDLVGLGNQERNPGTGLTDGYQIWAVEAAGIFVLGDANGDMTLSEDDIDDFVLALVDADGYSAKYSHLNHLWQNDVNRDLMVDGRDMKAFAYRLAHDNEQRAQDIHDTLIKLTGLTSE